MQVPLKEGWAEGMIGHATAIEYLARSASSGRLGQALLFVGPERVGKAALARRFAAALLDVAEVGLETHPDFALVERERDAKTGKLHADISIDQVRALISRLSLGAMMAGWKAAVIDGVQLLNAASANGLLKTLEEPHPNTMLLLTATTVDQVLPTVRSRCQVIRLERVPAAEIAAALLARRSRGITPERAELYARLSGGRPGAAVAYADDPSLLEEMFTQRDAILAMPAQAIADRFAAVERAVPPKMPFQDSLDRARAWTDLAAELLRDALLIRLGAADRVVHVDAADRLAAWAADVRLDPAAALASIEASRRQLDANVSPRASLDAVVAAL